MNSHFVPIEADRVYRNSRKTIDFNRWIQSLEPSRLSRVLNKTLPWLKFY